QVVCPLCGGDIVQTAFGYGCANYNGDAEGSCRFSIGKIAGVKLKESQIKQLLTTGKTDMISGFKSKAGKKFEAALKLEEGRVAFDFPDRPAPQETTLACPKCGAFMRRSQWYYECSCGFRISHTVAKQELSQEVMQELFTRKRTSQKVAGFTSKAGNIFDAYLTYDDKNGISFDFNEAPVPDMHAGQPEAKQPDAVKTGQQEDIINGSM
ncbi:MAG: topoisomerase C-terminal repeat-containing protein, partial [Lachnospiraceae bacterium]|nr:topoisomerase C-terminal repeat-containing protein [Lachnospiraceae bacterium]